VFTDPLRFINIYLFEAEKMPILPNALFVKQELNSGELPGAAAFPNFIAYFEKNVIIKKTRIPYVKYRLSELVEKTIGLLFYCFR